MVPVQRLLLFLPTLALLVSACQPAAAPLPTAAPTVPAAAAKPAATSAPASAPAAASAASPAAASGACTPAQGVTDTTIKLGMATPLSGAAASLGTDGKDGAEAFVSWVNDQGGINGRQLQLVTQDDKFDPQTAVQANQYLVSQEKVFAVWGNIGSAPASASAPIITGANVLFLFPYSLSKNMTEPLNKDIFVVVPSGLAQARTLSDYLGAQPDAADRKFGTLVINTPDGAEAQDGFSQGAAGKALVSKLTYDTGSVTFKSQLLALQSAGVTDAYMHMNDVDISKALTEASQSAVSMRFWGSSGLVSQRPFQLAPGLTEGLNGIVFTSQVNDDVPGIQQFKTIMAKYKPQANLGQFSLHSYLSGLVLKAGLEKAGQCLTTDSVRQAFESIKNLDTAGLTGPVSFSPTDHLGNKAVKIVQARADTWVPITDFVLPKS